MSAVAQASSSPFIYPAPRVFTRSEPARTIVMISDDSRHVLGAILKARAMKWGGLPIGDLLILSDCPQEEKTRKLLARFKIDPQSGYRYKAAGLKRYSDKATQTLSPVRAEHMAWLKGEWEAFQPDVVLLAKYMTILEGTVLDTLPWGVINVHHGILPAYPGRYALAQAIQAGSDVTGATCHFATKELDQGPTITKEPFRIDRGPKTADRTVEELVKENIPRMRESEVIALLRGAGLFLNRHLLCVENNGFGKAKIPGPVRKQFRVVHTGGSGIFWPAFGEIPLLSSGWRYAFGQTGWVR